MTNVLAIAYYFSEENSSTGQILRRFFPDLPQDDFNTTVITKLAGHMPESSDSCSLVGVRERNWAVLAEKVLRNVGLRDITMTPDHFLYSWGLWALKKAESLVRRQKYDYVHTISFPSSSHLIGYRIKRKYGLPWVAQFYDPWHGNPYRPIRNGTISRIDACQEALVAEYADLIILPCKELIDLWVERYGPEIRARLFELPFIAGYVDDTGIKSRNTHNSLVITQIGRSNSRRYSNTFLLAVREFLNEWPEYRSRLRIEYVGLLEERETELITGYGLDDVVLKTGQLPEMDCIPYFENADVFLAVDGDVDSNYFFPSKLLKYFNYQKPILGLVTKGSVLERELNTAGHYCIGKNDIEGIKKFLKRAIDDYSSICAFDYDYRAKFSPEVVINSYVSRVKSL